MSEAERRQLSPQRQRSHHKNKVAARLRHMSELAHQRGVNGHPQFLRLLAEYLEGTAVSLGWFEQQLEEDCNTFEGILRAKFSSKISVREEHLEFMRKYFAEQQPNRLPHLNASDSDADDVDTLFDGGLWEDEDEGWEKAGRARKPVIKRKVLDRYETMMFEFKTIQCPRDIRGEACRDLDCEKWHSSASPPDRRRPVRTDERNDKPPWAYKRTDFKNQYEFLYHPEEYKVLYTNRYG